MPQDRVKVLYLTYAGADVRRLVRQAAGQDFEVLFLNADDDSERCRKIAECEAVICAATPLRRHHLEAAKKLAVVHHQGVGWQASAAAASTVIPSVGSPKRTKCDSGYALGTSMRCWLPLTF